MPRGNRPAVVVVDFSYGFTDTQYPTASEATAQLAATKRMCDAARAKGFPVIFSTIAYHPGELDTLTWLKKSTGMRALVEGTRLTQIDEATGILPTDPVVVKKGASSFFGSTLGAILTAARVDTLVVAGATTSGCVRATVVDAVQSGYNVLCVEDCCADRASAPHQASLYDIQQKYGDVVTSDDVLSWFDSLDQSAGAESAA
ncbi:MAG: isochorismatase family protein [Celeribacter sp.]